MKIFITGSTGFIAASLIPALLQQGHKVLALVRSEKHRPLPPEACPRPERSEGQGVELVMGDGVKEGTWQEKVREADIVIHLAGTNIAQPWSKEVKEDIYNSRIKTAHHIVNALSGTNKYLVSTSAIGYYGFCQDETITEESPGGNDFLACVCKAWEEEAKAAQSKGVTVFIPRLGVVLGHGGSLEKMVKMFRYFLGAKLGSGKQWFSWIHIKDLIHVFQMAIAERWEGIYNVCSPNPVRNAELTSVLAGVLRVPAILPAPGFMLKVVLGEFANVVLEGQRVSPQKLLQRGFPYQFPSLKEALKDLVKTM
jgi:uncharacterized protein (TIGR01777 family)